MICVNCKLEKDDSQFQRRRKHSGYCDLCIKEGLRKYGREHYYKYKRSELSIIYKIDFNDGDFYIGSTNQILKERLRLHFSHSFNDNHSGLIHQKIRETFDKSTHYLKLLQSSSIIEKVKKEDRFKREMFWIRELEPTLNINQHKIKIKNPPKKGENHPNSKLKKDDVIKIRELYKNGNSKTNISKMFNINSMTVSQIVNFKTWKDVI
jgi:hypothetical protein